ncbi:MAG: nucleoside-diphosphate sugar epimerase/dehydratase, partial [Chitinophagaceae bacterium]
MASKKQPLISIKWYLLTDFLAISLASYLGYVYIDNSEILSFFASPSGFWKASLFFIGFLGGFWLIGNYQLGLYHKSRLNELTDTLWITLIYLLIWVLIIRLGTTTFGMGYFTLLYCKFSTLFFVVIGFFRFVLLIYIKNQLYNSSVYFATLIIGNNTDAVKAYQSVHKNYHYTGWKIVGYVSAEAEQKNGLHKFIPCLGTIQQLNTVINKKAIEQIIIALDKSQKDQIDAIVRQYSNSLSSIKMIPSTLDI